MNFTIPILYPAAPEIFMLIMASVILIVDVFMSKRFKHVTYLLVQLTLGATFLIVLAQFNGFPTPFLTFNDSYIIDKLAILTKLFILTTSIFAFVYAKQYIQDRNIGTSEYYILGLFAVLGMMVMASAYSLLTIYLGLELLSLSLYAMVALDKRSSNAVEAAMKYFVMGALASGILLYGISIIYGVTGSIDISND